jgi:hypothetical protein
LNLEALTIKIEDSQNIPFELFKWISPVFGLVGIRYDKEPPPVGEIAFIPPRAALLPASPA